ncbi:MAG TPA: 30S ribosomal protein S9 [Patescibacteria group bacterium]|jgi:small subunit ribosomal protein S9|nr:30S ribosomal protein S9 [Patescibacteria group bacterium]
MPTSKNDYFYGLGRRKSSTARVRVKGGNGEIVINNKPAEEYFSQSKYLLNKLAQPFTSLEHENKYSISVKVAGGGPDGQAEAIRLGISKALVLLNEEFKGTLKRAGMLSGDSREKERKKFGLKGARKQRQFTKR